MKQLTIILDNTAQEPEYENAVQAFYTQVDEQHQSDTHVVYANKIDGLWDSLSPTISAHVLVVFLNGTILSDNLLERITIFASSPQTWMSVLYSNVSEDAVRIFTELSERYHNHFITQLDLSDQKFRGNLNKLVPFVLDKIADFQVLLQDNDDMLVPQLEENYLTTDDTEALTPSHLDEYETPPEVEAPPVSYQVSVKKPLTPSKSLQQTSPRKTNEQNAISAFLKPILFNYLEPLSKSYPYPTEDSKAERGVSFPNENTWVISAASVRGRKHRNEGTNRDDAFTIKAANDWHIIAVADGAGSAEFSRVTANESVKVAVATLTAHAQKGRDTDPAKIEARMQAALQEAIEKVYQTQEDWTSRLNVTKKQTYTTFMILVHQPLPDGNAVAGWFHVGDGYMCAVNPERVRAMTKGDHGSEQSTSYFVLSFPLDELLKRAQVYTFQKPDVPNFFALMTDGIEDDLKPSSQEYASGLKTIDDNVESFVRNLQNHYTIWPCIDDWGTLLLDAISYERKGSNDDRTLVLLTTVPNNIIDC